MQDRNAPFVREQFDDVVVVVSLRDPNPTNSKKPKRVAIVLSNPAGGIDHRLADGPQ